MKRALLIWMQTLLYFRRCSTFLTTQRSSSSSPLLASSVPVDLKFIEFTKEPQQQPHDADPVLLLHGLLGQKRNWASLGAALVNQLERKRRIYALDLRNHGDNTHDWRDQMTYSQMAEDVLHFMNQQKMEKAVCIGHSMGGKVAKVLALRHPKRVSGLVVLDIAPVTYDATTDSHWKAVETIIQALSQLKLDDKEGKTKKELEVELRPTIHDPALRAFALTNIEVSTNHGGSSAVVKTLQKPMLRWKVNLNAIQQQLHVLAGFDYHYTSEDDLLLENEIRYHGDTYFILGGQSKFVRNAYIPTISNHFPNYMMTTIKGSGHWVHSEAPDDTLLLLKRYLDR